MFWLVKFDKVGWHHRRANMDIASIQHRSFTAVLPHVRVNVPLNEPEPSSGYFGNPDPEDSMGFWEWLWRLAIDVSGTPCHPHK